MAGVADLPWTSTVPSSGIPTNRVRPVLSKPRPSPKY